MCFTLSVTTYLYRLTPCTHGLDVGRHYQIIAISISVNFGIFVNYNYIEFFGIFINYNYIEYKICHDTNLESLNFIN